MYTVIGTARSRAFRVLWMLEELGQPYEHDPAPPRSDAVRAVNPAGKIPVLRVDGGTITDSTAILTYLADRHGALTAPPGTVARAQQDGVLHMVLDELDACLWMAARHSFVLPEDQRVPAVKDSLKREFAASLARLSARLEDGPYLMGAELTVPDIVAVHCGGWAQRAGFPVEDARFAAYLDRGHARPAHARAAER
ncbi:glutathione S-transferase family protein [Rhodobacteraceae bacterium CCMM004]|nr:glutathione S-transferase family protein [Rhodobacteraceae bacterium CCMM004]